MHVNYCDWPFCLKEDGKKRRRGRLACVVCPGVLPPQRGGKRAGLKPARFQQSPLHETHSVNGAKVNLLVWQPSMFKALYSGFSVLYTNFVSNIAHMFIATWSSNCTQRLLKFARGSNKYHRHWTLVLSTLRAILGRHDVQMNVLSAVGYPRLPKTYFFPETSKMMWKTFWVCLLYTSPSPRDRTRSRMPSSA